MVRADFIGPLAPGQRRETDQEQRNRLDAEFLADVRRERLQTLARTIPESQVRDDIIGKFERGEKLTDAERNLFLDGLELRAENLKRVGDLVREREKIEALTDIALQSADVLLAAVPVPAPARAVAAGRKGGSALRLAENPLTRREARKLATRFLNREAFQAKEFVKRRQLEQALKTLEQARRRELRQAARQAAARRAGGRAGSGVSKTAKGPNPAAARRAAQRRAAAGKSSAAQARARRAELKAQADQQAAQRRVAATLRRTGSKPAAAAETIDRAKPRLSPRQLRQEQRKINREIATAQRKLGKAGTAAERRALTRTVQTGIKRRVAIGAALALAAGTGLAIAASRGRKSESSPAASADTSPAPSAGPAAAIAPTVAVKTGGGSGTQQPPGPLPPTRPASESTPAGTAGTGSGSRKRRRGSTADDGVTTVRLRIPRGTNPAEVTFRTGVVERQEDLRTGKTRFGRDLEPAVTNNPKVSPAESVRITETTRANVKLPTVRKIGNRQLRIDKVNPNTVELKFSRRASSGRRARRPKLVKSRGEK